MADLQTILPAAYAALGAIGPPVVISGDPEPDGDPVEIIVLLLVADTARPAYGGSPTDTLIQTTCYAATYLRAAELDSAARGVLYGAGLQHRQSRFAPDADAIGILSEFTT